MGVSDFSQVSQFFENRHPPSLLNKKQYFYVVSDLHYIIIVGVYISQFSESKVSVESVEWFRNESQNKITISPAADKQCWASRKWPIEF
jgi:hypothetical protein